MDALRAFELGEAVVPAAYPYVYGGQGGLSGYWEDLVDCARSPRQCWTAAFGTEESSAQAWQAMKAPRVAEKAQEAAEAALHPEAEDEGGGVTPPPEYVPQPKPKPKAPGTPGQPTYVQESQWQKLAPTIVVGVVAVIALMIVSRRP